MFLFLHSPIPGTRYNKYSTTWCDSRNLYKIIILIIIFYNKYDHNMEVESMALGGRKNGTQDTSMRA